MGTIVTLPQSRWGQRREVLLEAVVKAIPLLLAHSMGDTLRAPVWSGTPLRVNVWAQLIPGQGRALCSWSCSHCSLLTERNTHWSSFHTAEPSASRQRCNFHISQCAVNASLSRKAPPARCSPPYLLDRSLAAFHLFFLGDCRVPVAHQAVVLNTVVLVSKKPVGFHFPFALGKKRREQKTGVFMGYEAEQASRWPELLPVLHLLSLLLS